MTVQTGDGTPRAASFSPEDLAEFDRLTLLTSSIDQCQRIEGRLHLRKFVRTHGKPTCDEMWEALKTSRAGTP